MIFAKDGSTVRAGADPPGSQQLRAAPRLRLHARRPLVVRGGYGIFYSHTVGRGAKGCSASTRRTWWTTCCRRASRGAAAVASAAPFRLGQRLSVGLLDPNALAPTVARRAQDANQRTPYIQQYNIGVQYELMPDLVLDVAYRRQQGHEADRLPQSEPARRHHQPGRLAVGRRAALSGLRRHPVDGESRQLQLQLAAVRLEKRFSQGPVGARQLHLGEALTDAPDHISTSGGGAGVDTGMFREPQDGNNLRAERGPAEFDIRHRFVASYVWELPFGHGRRFGKRLDRADRLRARRLAADRHSRRCRAASR